MTEKKEAKKQNKIYGVYIPSQLTQKVHLHISEIGKNLKQNLEKKIIHKNEGKCIEEGFIKPYSVKIISYSSGIISSEYVYFDVLFECKVCHPVEGMMVECIVKDITIAGIHAEVIVDGVVPVVVFVARDHHIGDKLFNNIKSNSKIIVRIIGIRFELNDEYICAIGQLTDEVIEDEKRRGGNIIHDQYPKTKLVLEEELYQVDDYDVTQL